MKMWLLRHRFDLIPWLALGAVFSVSVTCGLVERANHRNELAEVQAQLDGEPEYAENYVADEYWREAFEDQKDVFMTCYQHEGIDRRACLALNFQALQADIRVLRQQVQDLEQELDDERWRQDFDPRDFLE